MTNEPRRDASLILPSENLPEQRAASEAISQAEDLLVVARATTGLGKHGVARSIAILGLEEAAKAFAYRMVALRAGWFKGGTPAESCLEGAQELGVSERELNRLHPEKHALDAGLEFMLNVFEGITSLIANFRARGELDPHVVEEFTNQIAQRLVHAIETTEKLNNWKNEGFYVGRSGPEIWTPRRVSADEAATVIGRLERRLAFVAPLVRFKEVASDLEEVARAMLGSAADAILQDSTSSGRQEP